MDPFERRTDASGVTVLLARNLSARGVVAAFTERTGGHSGPPFESLNLGFKEGDDPGAVRANRDAVCAALAMPPFATAQQVHGSRVGVIDAAARGRGYASPAGAAAGCDALATTDPSASLAILTADCVPVALADEGRLVAVHAGWRGLAAGVVDRALQSFSSASRVSAAIGPAIGPCHYEVRDDVLTAAAWGSDRLVRRGTSWSLDLPGVVTDRLREAGVTDVASGAPCTACETDRFFSYRRDGRTGRQALVLARQ